MSIIIAGKACKYCGEKYYFSMGHTQWFDRWVRKKKSSPQSKRYNRIRRNGICPRCFTGVIEPGAQAVAMIKRIEYGRVIKRRKS